MNLKNLRNRSIFDSLNDFDLLSEKTLQLGLYAFTLKVLLNCCIMFLLNVISYSTKAYLLGTYWVLTVIDNDTTSVFKPLYLNMTSEWPLTRTIISRKIEIEETTLRSTEWAVSDTHFHRSPISCLFIGLHRGALELFQMKIESAPDHIIWSIWLISNGFDTRFWFFIYVIIVIQWLYDLFKFCPIWIAFLWSELSSGRT